MAQQLPLTQVRYLKSDSPSYRAIALYLSILHPVTSMHASVLEGKGVKVGLIVSEGFRQILHIDRSYVPGGLAAFITWNKGPLLAPLESTIEVR